MIAAIDPSLFTWTEGAVRVQTNGIARGLTILYNKQKRYVSNFWVYLLISVSTLINFFFFLLLFTLGSNRFEEETEWTDKPSVKVAVTVDAPRVVKLVMDRLISS